MYEVRFYDAQISVADQEKQLANLKQKTQNDNGLFYHNFSLDQRRSLEASNLILSPTQFGTTC